MYLVLFGIGLLFAAAGFVTIGFGIPINAFSLGNTLIIAGTVAVVGGLVLVGIAVAVRQLNRIVEAIGRSAMRAAPAHDVAADSHVPPTVRIQPPPRPAPPAKPEPVAPKHAELPPKPPELTMPRPPEPRPAPVEPRFPVTSGEATVPLDWLRSKSRPEAPPVAAEPPVVEVPDEAPLSPRAPQRPAFVPPSVGDLHVEPKAWSPGRQAGSHEELPRETRVDVPPRAEPAPRVAPSAERPKEPSPEPAKSAAKDSGLFDVVWPDARSRPISAAEPRREPRSEPKSESRFEPKPEPPRPTAPGPERSAAAILKSGVIDGMAYTLYVDGSIEAELPQGTVKFASVDALRVHLEKNT